MSIDLEGFTPGVHCTSCRIRGVLTRLDPARDLSEPALAYTCEACRPAARDQRKRSAAAMRAVETKRRTYDEWPSRARKHTRRK